MHHHQSTLKKHICLLKVSFILTAIFAKTTPVNAKTVRVSYRKSSYGAATKIQIVRTIKANTNGAETKVFKFEVI